MAAVLRRGKMREGSVTGLNSQWGSASYAGNQFPQHLTLSLGGFGITPRIATWKVSHWELVIDD